MVTVRIVMCYDFIKNLGTLNIKNFIIEIQQLFTNPCKNIKKLNKLITQLGVTFLPKLKGNLNILFIFS